MFCLHFYYYISSCLQSLLLSRRSRSADLATVFPFVRARACNILISKGRNRHTSSDFKKLADAVIHRFADGVSSRVDTFAFGKLGRRHRGGNWEREDVFLRYSDRFRYTEKERNRTKRGGIGADFMPERALVRPSEKSHRYFIASG